MAPGELTNWKQEALTLIGVVLGVLFAPGLGLYTFMTAMPPLHRSAQDIPSVPHGHHRRTGRQRWTRRDRACVRASSRRTLETISLAGDSTPMASHASRTLLGGSTSFLTFPERGLVVAVTSNTSFANTRAIALSIAHVFAQQGKSPSRQ
jgi:hypothetical protein